MGLNRKCSSGRCTKQQQPCCKKRPVSIKIDVCEEPKASCVPECCSCPCACCKPGCSPRKPCLACVKKGVKVKPVPTKCLNPCAAFCGCPEKMTMKTRCEVKRETDCSQVCNTRCKSKQDECRATKQHENDMIDYCNMVRESCDEERNDCKTFTNVTNSCKNVKQCPCTNCKIIRCNDKICEKSCINNNVDDERKCCPSSCTTRNSCKTSRQAVKDLSCLSSSCPKSCTFMDNCCNEKCTVYEHGDCMSYLPMGNSNCYEPQNLPETASTCLPSVGTFVVPQTSKQTPIPCPCGSRSCGNAVMVFQ